MSLPEAIAITGSTRPRPKRVGMIAGVMAAVFVLIHYLATPVPDRLVALLGGPSSGVARDGGLRMSWRPPPGVDAAAIAQQFEHGDGRATVHVVGDHLAIEVTGVHREEVQEMADQLAAGQLEFHEVIESPEMLKLAQVLGLEMRHREPYDLEVDQWRPEDGGKDHTDYYLFAYSRATLDEAFALAKQRGWTLPDGMHVAYERVEAPAGARDQRVYWRSYVLADLAEIDGNSIVNAVRSYDPNTGRPTVLLDFDREGGRKFGDLTSRIVGRKLAIVVGGDVKSAPVINSAIRGGRASIAMGTNDPERQEREADALVTILRAGPLPGGGTVLAVEYVAKSGVISEWLARGVLVIGGGAAIGLLAWLLARLTRPQRRTEPALAGRAPIVGRLVWTFVPFALVMFGSTVVLPWVNDVELRHVLAQGWRSGTDVSQLSVLALGIMPAITTFIIVELVALAVPRWRALRDTPEGRRRLGYAIAIGTFVVALVQGYFVAVFAQSMSRGGVELCDPGMASRLGIAFALAAGVAFTLWMVAIIGSKGIGNGYAVLFVAGAAVKIVRSDALGSVDPAQLALLAAGVAGVALIVVAMTSWRVRGLNGAALPLPTCGQVPLIDAGGLMLVATTIASLGFDRTTSELIDLSAWLDKFTPIVVIVLSLFWAWVFARPGLRRAQLERAGVASPDRATWLRAALLSLVMLVAISAVSSVAKGEVFLGSTVVMFAAATIADVIAELRARARSELVAVWPISSPLLAEAARDRLAAEGIPHHLQSARLRALLWFFGPYVPIMVLVPPADAARAEKLLREITQ